MNEKSLTKASKPNHKNEKEWLPIKQTY